MGGLRRAALGFVERLAAVRGRAMPEAELGRPAVVFAPHQDDETLGCGGLITLKRRRGVPVRVVFLTDGRASHGKFMAGEELAQRRRAEAVAACRELGVPSEDVTFLGFPDGALASAREAATTAVATLLGGCEGWQIYLPYRGDTTADHVDTRQVVLTAAARTAGTGAWTVCEYPVWFWHHWPWVAPPLSRRLHLPRLALRSAAAIWRRLVDLTEFVAVASVLAEKERALACHGTQTVRPPDHPDWPILADVAQGAWLARFFDGREQFCRYEVRTTRSGR